MDGPASRREEFQGRLSTERSMLVLMVRCDLPVRRSMFLHASCLEINPTASLIMIHDAQFRVMCGYC